MDNALADTKGGGRGGPQRWTGRGPRPARHIPWPELFKHHESVLKGHLKMMDMVRKHCVEGSGNWKTAQACVDRTHEMVRDFKKSVYSFVPPTDNIDRVPLGASSASMYPGYSPADHIYGEAAHEYGQMIAEARKKGQEIGTNPDGIEYVVGQSSKEKKEQLEDIKRRRGEARDQAEPTNGTSSVPEETDGVEPEEEEEDLTALFTFDPNPTPLPELKTGPDAPKSKANESKKVKRDHTTSAGTESLSTTETAPKAKKVKHSAPLEEEIAPAPADDFEDAVAARKAKKEEKRRQKEEKKRKRQSDSSQGPAPDSQDSHTANEQASAAEPTVSQEQDVPERPKKKKQKKGHESGVETTPAVVTTPVPVPTSTEEAKIPEKKVKKDKKDKKRSKDEAEPVEDDSTLVQEGEKKKKKRKKDRAE